MAVSYSYHVYDDGAPSFDIGSPTNAVELLASGDVKGFHFDTDVFFTELVQESVRRAQFGQTLSVSYPITQKFELTGELWHFTQPFLQSNAIGNLWALSYAPRKNLVLDVGFDRGLTGTFAGRIHLSAAPSSVESSLARGSLTVPLPTSPSREEKGARTLCRSGSSFQLLCNGSYSSDNVMSQSSHHECRNGFRRDPRW